MVTYTCHMNIVRDIRIGSKYWYKVMMILLLCMVNESWCFDVSDTYPYRKRGRFCATFVQGRAITDNDARESRCSSYYTTSKYYQGRTSSPPAVFLYLSSSINVVRSIQKDVEVFLSGVDAHFVAHSAEECGFPQKFDRYLIHCILWAYYYQRLGNNTIWIFKL